MTATREVFGFTRSPATPQEIRDKRTAHMLVCDQCGQRIVPSGLGVGAHRRKHRKQS